MNDLRTVGHLTRLDVDDVEHERPLPGDVDAAKPEPLTRQLIGVAVRRKWTIIGSVAVMLALGLLVSLLITPRYTATTSLEISRETSRIVNIEGVEPQVGGLDLEFYQTQYGLLRSSALAASVAERLRLVDRRDFFEAFLGSRAEELFSDTGTAAAARQSRAERQRVAVDILLDNISVNPLRGSRLTDLSFSSPNPNLSEQIANGWAQRFIESNLERRFQASSYARNFLASRLEEVRQRLESSERALVQYASSQRIINLPATTTANGPEGERSLTADELATINEALATATSQRIAAQSRWQSSGSTPEALGNDTINSLRRDRAQSQAEYTRMMQQFEPNYPPALALRAQIAEFDRSIAREEGRVRDMLGRTYRESLAREQALRSRVQQLTSNLLDLRRRSIQYTIHQRDVDTNRQLYDGLLQRYREIGITGGIGANNVAIIDSAEVPTRPSYPNILLNLIIALTLGLMLGVALALVREQLEDAVEDPETIRRDLKLPLLGTVPNLQRADPIAEMFDVKSSMVESVLSIQTSLEFATDRGMPRAICLTSSHAGEGKSTTAAALAASLARSGKRVVLVDGDMRSPSVHLAFDLANTSGLSNYLAGDNDLKALIRPTQLPTLHVLSAGPQPPNAAVLLAGDRLDLVINALSAEYDHIIVDGPPVLGLADAPIIGKSVGSLIFIIQAHDTGVRLIKSALARLRSAGVNVIGAILVKYDMRRSGYGYGYGSTYGYGYGKSEQETAAPSTS